MDTTGYIALSRQLTLQRNMAVIAQNIANAGTTGYRAEHALLEPVAERAGDGRRLAFVQDVGLARDLAPGPVQLTGNPLDVAVRGEGYLAFQTPAGERYGRAGRLELDASGRLVDPAGNPVLDEAGAPVVLPPGERRPTIAEDGTVAAGEGGPVARLQLVAFGDEQALRREGDGLYRADAVPRPATGGLVQGALEGSNVAAVSEMTAMLATVRAFEGVQKLLETQHETAMRAIDRMISVQG